MDKVQKLVHNIRKAKQQAKRLEAYLAALNTLHRHARVMGRSADSGKIHEVMRGAGQDLTEARRWREEMEQELRKMGGA